MKKTSMMLVLMVVALCLTATTALAAQIVLEERIDSVTGSPVKEEFSFYGQGFEDFILKVQNQFLQQLIEVHRFEVKWLS